MSPMSTITFASAQMLWNLAQFVKSPGGSIASVVTVGGAAYNFKSIFSIVSSICSVLVYCTTGDCVATGCFLVALCISYFRTEKFIGYRALIGTVLMIAATIVMNPTTDQHNDPKVDVYAKAFHKVFSPVTYHWDNPRKSLIIALLCSKEPLKCYFHNSDLHEGKTATSTCMITSSTKVGGVIPGMETWALDAFVNNVLPNQPPSQKEIHINEAALCLERTISFALWGLVIGLIGHMFHEREIEALYTERVGDENPTGPNVQGGWPERNPAWAVGQDVEAWLRGAWWCVKIKVVAGDGYTVHVEHNTWQQGRERSCFETCRDEDHDEFIPLHEIPRRMRMPTDGDYRVYPKPLKGNPFFDSIVYSWLFGKSITLFFVYVFEMSTLDQKTRLKLFSAGVHTRKLQLGLLFMTDPCVVYIMGCITYMLWKYKGAIYHWMYATPEEKERALGDAEHVAWLEAVKDEYRDIVIEENNQREAAREAARQVIEDNWRRDRMW
jgi:hypothetical protein